jgi:hypothetical protein
MLCCCNACFRSLFGSSEVYLLLLSSQLCSVPKLLQLLLQLCHLGMLLLLLFRGLRNLLLWLLLLYLANRCL